MKRCAIYTRKSHEEGLEQAFNSLDAQREAGIDYIRSQRHEGWQAITTQYDDGGYSGGNMDRPGLKALLGDIERGRVDVVVVYKVDRLSRSLHDFAQIMKVFDQHQVSFVSVTQQFNTTTSMGRLTLNMLLSFAQFEREVTGERIRDKLAATKKKGLWITGQPPLGYRTVEQVLTIIPEEAAFVRRMYEDYLKDQSPVDLAMQYNREGLTTRRWTSPSSGRSHGGKPLTPKWVYRILTNPVYIGKITHKEHIWPGQHEAIISQDLWQQVQDAIHQQDRQTRHAWTHTHLLKAKIKTYEGFTMSPSSVQRKARAGGPVCRVRYYVSQKAMQEGYKNCLIKAVNGDRLDDLIRAMVLNHLQKRENYTGLHVQEPQVRDHWLREVLRQVTVAPSSLTVELNVAQIEACKANPSLQVREGQTMDAKLPVCVFEPKVEQRGQHIQLTLAIQIKKMKGNSLLLSLDGKDLVILGTPTAQPHIMMAIGRAYLWHEELLRSGCTMQQLANEKGVSKALVHKLLPLTNLSPSILKQALAGSLPATLTLDDLLKAADDLDWNRQARNLGLAMAIGT